MLVILCYIKKSTLRGLNNKHFLYSFCGSGIWGDYTGWFQLRVFQVLSSFDMVPGFLQSEHSSL